MRAALACFGFAEVRTLLLVRCPSNPLQIDPTTYDVQYTPSLLGRERIYDLFLF